ncbi:dicarboxylate/amino acid:cation symporter [Kytococcus sedentarius]|uniref:dicarboxylate/amino acid:cation symporter n=1 Tax=Kytococcus sedentarius TaxID=1276 RepID=UPI00194FFB33|nr:dicarboxylate/amino acid:cation symporter [Kytococcus sedentarius]QRO88338.1 dicarboxylate/amino acid:cation symporter [Kytococcus sedentarius]
MSASSSAATVESRSAQTLSKRRWLPSFGMQILLGLVVGVALGAVARTLGGDAENPNWLTETLTIVGTTFITMLKALVPPLIFLAVVASIANLRDLGNAARLAGQTLIWFGITALVSVTIGIVLSLVTRPGANTSVSPDAAAAPDGGGSWLDFLTGLVPTNILGLSAEAGEGGAVSLSFNALQIVVIAIAFGIAAIKVGKEAEPFLGFSQSALAIVQKILWWVILLAPIGTAGLIGRAVATYGWTTMGSLGIFVLTVYAGLALVLLGVYPAVLKAHGLSVRQWFSGAWPAIQLAFVSRSSLGTMPLTQRVTERNLGVPSGYASFAIPFGATTKMDGCAAIYPAVSAIFVAQFFGLELGITDYLLIVVVSVLGSAATAGLTGALVMLTLTLSTLGLPLEGVGLLLAVDPILDMGRTAVNVAGQTLVPTIVAKREGILDRALYEAPRGELPYVDESVTEQAEQAPGDAAGIEEPSTRQPVTT